MKHLVESCSFIFLLIMHVKTQEHITVQTLDMADEAFDDQYIGCRNQMEEAIISKELLKHEKTQSTHFKRAWEEAEDIWRSQTKRKVKSLLPDGFEDNHGVAIVAHSGFINKDFNEAVKSAGKSYSYYKDNFHFKAFHYYLTVALQLLSGNCKQSKKLVYRGMDNVHFKPPTDSHHVKFGQFLSTSLDINQAKMFGNDTFFTIITCFGVHIDAFSQFPREHEVLVPAYEVFTVSSFVEEHYEFSLTTTETNCSNYNCAYLGGGETWPNSTFCIYNSAPSGRNLPLLTLWSAVLLKLINTV
ncbi:ecto-ADP-ribosyltransferase 5-like isoform X2 [Ascaphus truei]|uniref:ecto-ADP-ribosyltransferase 5-like isoform X2 n=1 Tax=Ascaphus truei TaxID=8439 RepID=UPI003F5A6969